MGQLLYFVEGPTRVGIERARALGLGYAFPVSMACGDFTGAGPGGSQGCILCGDGERLGYHPDKQTWLRVPPSQLGVDLKELVKEHGVTGVFVGCWKEDRPKPSDLAVPRQLQGRLVKLDDGNDWMIPVARAWSDRQGSEGWYCALPGAITLDESGQWTSGGVKPQFARLWEIACAWWNELWGRTPDENNEIRFDFAGAHDAVLAALATNYRLGKAEIALLGLLDDQFYCARAILDVVVDRATFMDWAKKNNPITPTSGGSSTGDGAQATTPTTGPR